MQSICSLLLCRKRMYFYLLLTTTTLLLSIIPAYSQPKNLLPGDPAPAFEVRNWLQKGLYDDVQPVNGRIITVIEFWADWCPISNHVLPMHNKMQRELKNKGVRFLTVAEGKLDNTKDVIRQVKPKNLAVVFDEEYATLSRFADPTSTIPMPFIVIIEQSNNLTQSRILWQGSAFTVNSDIYSKSCGTIGFDSVISQLLSGQYDINEHIRLEQDRRDIQWLSDEMWDACRAKRIDRMRALAQQAISRVWPMCYQGLLIAPLSYLATSLLDNQAADKSKLSESLKLAGVAINLGGSEYAAVNHIYARALFMNGDTKGAIDAEKKALSLPVKLREKEECTEALAKYEAALTGKSIENVKPDNAANISKTDERKSVTSDQAEADLLELYESMRMNYAGYDDATLQLTLIGSSWDERNAEFIEKINAQSQWKVADLYNLLVKYAKVIPDNHFLFGYRPDSSDMSSSDNILPFFSDLRVKEKDGRMLAQSVPDGLEVEVGDQIVGLTVIGTADNAKVGCTYLFPTLPIQPGVKEYLIGMLANKRSIPKELKIHISNAALGKNTVEVLLPLHRGRSCQRFYNDDVAAWSLQMKPVPVLAIRRFWGDEKDNLDEMTRTAISLRDEPHVIVDLRGNGGGNAQLGMDWFSGFTSSPYRCLSRAGMLKNQSGCPHKWNCTFVCAENSESIQDKSDKPYNGRLFIVTDNYSGSASEWFADATAQQPKALLIGENTSGCFTYASDFFRSNLANSGISIQFGTAKFSPFVRPAREGIGMFPDYWLDDPDPVSAIAAYCSLK